MAPTAAARLLSTEDVLLEILHRVSTDVVALFRCTVACKRWRALVADRCFLRRCWPENDDRGPSPSTLLGFFDRERVNVGVCTLYRLVFVPPPTGSVLGDRRRLLTSIVDGLPEDESSHYAEPLAARHGLLLVRLSSGHRCFESVNMAVCDPLTRTCHVLPSLECRVTYVSCTILTGADCRQHQSSLHYFKVLAMVFISNPMNSDNQECNLYTISSTELRWSAPRKCLGPIGLFGKRGFQFPERSSGNVVQGAMVHWLVPYYFDIVEKPPKYYTLDVSVDTSCASLTELPIPAKQLMSRPMLCVSADGSLSLFSIDVLAPMWRLHMWVRGNNVDTEVWLHKRVVELNVPRWLNPLWGIHMLPVEKSRTLFIIDDHQCQKIDVETGMVEEQRFQHALSKLAVPMNIEWPAWFASRLG
ncbi:unnamed protein product [Alopecurus aequalis]